MHWTWLRWRQKRQPQTLHAIEDLVRSGLLPEMQQSGRAWQLLMSSARPGMMAAEGVPGFSRCALLAGNWQRRPPLERQALSKQHWFGSKE